MITITNGALAALLLAFYITVDLALCGVLVLVRGLARRTGVLFLSAALLSACIPLAILDRFTQVDTGAYLALVLLSGAVYAVGDHLPRRRRPAVSTAAQMRFRSAGRIPSGRDFVRATAALIREKGETAVWFDLRSFDPALTKDELPWCRTLDNFIESVGTGGDDGRSIILTTWNDGYVHTPFTGTEDEDFDAVFHFVHDELCDPDTEPEADEWLASFLDREPS